MQLDMHYYGTWCLARAAGLHPEACTTIAAAAQYVDDNDNHADLVLTDGGRVESLATAHHPTQLIENTDDSDQRRVWVPFHFLPGNAGDDYTGRLVCVQESALAQTMVQHHLGHLQHPYGLEMLGIAAHVYSDTFSHHGFSGVSSRKNRVKTESIELLNVSDELKAYISDKVARFFARKGPFGGLYRNIRADVLDGVEEISGALGHGAVATYPDLPYLKWRFVYEDGRESRRDNQKSYLAACKALHAMFIRAGELRHDLKADAGREFSQIEPTLREILAVQAPCEGRNSAWKKQALSGVLFATGGESIPEYDLAQWSSQQERIERSDSHAVTGIPLFRFFQAAFHHRAFVLRDLLPENDIVVY